MINNAFLLAAESTISYSFSYSNAGFSYFTISAKIWLFNPSYVIMKLIRVILVCNSGK